MFYIIGYETCPFYKDACLYLKQANMPFYKREVTSKLALDAAVLDLCHPWQRRGVSGHTSPQIFQLQNGVIVCMGGCDHLKSIGMSLSF